jgi:hypothetical protein
MGKKKAMTEAQWEKCADPTRMLALLGDALSERKLRLFACACCRRIWDQVESYYAEDYGEESVEMFRKPVPVAEAYADGQATEDELSMAGGWLADVGEWGDEGPEYAFMACSRDVEGLREVPALVIYHGFGDRRDAATKREQAAQAALLRDVAGSPLREVPFDARWRTRTVTDLAKATYAKRTLPAGTLSKSRLSILADALEEAGCNEQALLGHLRSPGPHVRGCWPLDLCLEREVLDFPDEATEKELSED